jgi:hypothetical protein
MWAVGCIFLSVCRGEHRGNNVGLEEEISPKPATDGGKSFDSSRYNNLLRFYLQSRDAIAVAGIIS